MNLASIIEPHDAEAPALVSRRQTTTYGELRTQVAGIRGGLIGLGLTEDDRVGIVCANNWYFVASYLGVLGAGLVAVPLNPQSPAPELAKQLRISGARAVIVGPTARSGFEGIDLGELADLEHVITCAPDPGPDQLALESIMAAQPLAIVERGEDDLAVLMFTSGTAGPAKAAMLTHGNLSSNLRALQKRSDSAPVDTVLGVVPLHHIFGLNVVLGSTLNVGARIILVERFDPVSAVETIGNWGVTVIAGPPNLWSALAGLPAVTPEDFASVRVAVSGASGLPSTTRDLVRTRLGLTLAEGYGLTEAAPTVTSSTGIDVRPGSIGRVIPGLQVRLVDDDGDDVELGDSGEIWIRGPSVFKGYWNDPAATDAALTTDGWLRTGDVAVADEDGYLYVVDRLKDLIIVSGFNVYPAEVEEVLRTHPGVAAAAVVGVEHPHTGEAVKGFVVVVGGISVEEDEVIAYCQLHLARYKCPSKIEFVEELPAGLTGKILRRELKSAP